MKRSSKGKAYFYAYGQQDKLSLGGSALNTACVVSHYRKSYQWPMWAQIAYENGYIGF